jgi:hypothetical protein
MVHEGQGLALGLEPGDDLLSVHAQLVKYIHVKQNADKIGSSN